MPQSAHGLLELPQYKLPNGDLVHTHHGYADGVKTLHLKAPADSTTYSLGNGSEKDGFDSATSDGKQVSGVDCNNSPNSHAPGNTPSSKAPILSNSPKPHEDLATPTSDMAGASPFVTVRSGNGSSSGNIDMIASRGSRANSVGSIGPNDPAWSNLHGNESSPSVNMPSPSKHVEDLLGNEDSIELNDDVCREKCPNPNINNTDIMDPEHVAIFIMGHLDRLATAYLPTTGEFPSLLNTDTHTNDPSTITPTSSNGTFCVDSRPETFELLLSFFSITGCNMTNDTKHESLQSTPTLQNISKINRATRPQVVLACLKLLRANLANLISNSTSINAKLNTVLSHLKEKLIDTLQDPKQSVGLTDAQIRDPNKHLNGIPSNITQILYAIQTESANVLSVAYNCFTPVQAILSSCTQS